MTKEEIQNKYFAEDEEVLWSGTAETLRFFMRTDFILIPLTVIIGGFLLSYAYSSMMLMIRGQSVAFALSGITFLLIGLYLIFGRIWYRHKRLSRNFYFVTSDRCFVFNTLRDKVTVDIPINDVEPEAFQNDLFLSGKFLGGDIVYGLGLDVFFHNFVKESPAFTAIHSPEQVKKVIKRAKKNRKKAKHDTDDFI